MEHTAKTAGYCLLAPAKIGIEMSLQCFFYFFYIFLHAKLARIRTTRVRNKHFKCFLFKMFVVFFFKPPFQILVQIFSQTSEDEYWRLRYI